MPVKIRLTRRGKKRSPFYHIVIADGRAPRDGRYIESIGTYNPNTNPATIKLDFDRALTWLQDGAQPTDTCRAILSYNGVLFKKHLLDGVKKGAFNEEQAEAKFQSWLADKESKIQAKKDQVKRVIADDTKQRLDAEVKVNSDRAEELAKKNAAQAAEEAAEKAEKTVVKATEEVKEEATETPAAPEVKATEEATPEVKAKEDNKETEA